MAEWELIWKLTESGGLPAVVVLAIWAALKFRQREADHAPDPVAHEISALRTEVRELATEMTDRLARVETHIENLKGARR